MHSCICHLSRKREGTIGINVIIIFVLVILLLALTISILTKGSSSLGIFSDDKVAQDDETLSAEMIRFTDSNNVNIDTDTLMLSLTGGFNIISPVEEIIDCLVSTSDYCNYIDLSVSVSPPKYTYISEGVIISISFDNDSLYGSAEGYLEITLSGLYEINKTLLQSGSELALCKNPFEQTCYEYNSIPPTVTTVTLRVRVGQDISVRLPFYYDNLANPNTGVADEKTCTDKLKYSNIEAQATKLNVKVEGPSYPYDITIIHMEKPHEREYALYCGESIPNDTPKSFDVQVVSGDYDFFRIYGWNSLSCVNSLEDIPVKKGTTKDVTLKFNC